MKITYYGHSSFAVEIGNTTLVFDPFISDNGLVSNINVNDIKADYVLLSHGHIDHVADAEAITRNNDATIISNFEIVSWFQNKGCEKGHPMNHGGAKKFDFGTVKYVQAVHSSVLPDGSYGGNPGGFIVETKEGSFYYAGDTALFMDMKLFGRYHKIDFAFLPIGDNFTMGPSDAAISATFVKCKEVIGMHYDTFGYIEIDKEAAIKEFNESGIKLNLMNIGETINI